MSDLFVELDNILFKTIGKCAQKDTGIHINTYLSVADWRVEEKAEECNRFTNLNYNPQRFHMNSWNQRLSWNAKLTLSEQQWSGDLETTTRDKKSDKSVKYRVKKRKKGQAKKVGK